MSSRRSRSWPDGVGLRYQCSGDVVARYEFTDGGSISLTPTTVADELRVWTTSHWLSRQTRLILRAIVAIDDRPVFFPLREWQTMGERRRNIVAGLWLRENTRYEQAFTGILENMRPHTHTEECEDSYSCEDPCAE